MVRLISLFFLMISVSTPTWAYLESAESGDISPKGVLKMGIAPQFVFSPASGTDVTAFLGSALRDDMSWRANIGGGGTASFYGGGDLKWIPIPDYQNQPAIGGFVEMELASVSSIMVTSFRVAPLVSKKFEGAKVVFTPYVALPIGVAGSSGNSNTFVQLALGTDFKVNEWKEFSFTAELGSNLSNSFSYLSLNAFYYFDTKSRSLR